MSDSALNYAERQVVRDREYTRAWKNAPKRFLNAASKHGLQCEPDQSDGMAIEFEQNYVESSYRPDMSALLDTHIDFVVEKYGHQNECLVRSIAKDLKQPFELEVVRNRSFLLYRVAGYLIKEEGPRLLPRVHALLHSIPGLAKQAGYGSLRLSAAKCQVSAEWLRRRRDKWCHMLAIPIPVESRKSDEARGKYRVNACNNHWRRQIFKNNGTKHNGTNGTNGTNGHSAASLSR